MTGTCKINLQMFIFLLIITATLKQSQEILLHSHQPLLLHLIQLTKNSVESNWSLKSSKKKIREKWGGGQTRN